MAEVVLALDASEFDDMTTHPPARGPGPGDPSHRLAAVCTSWHHATVIPSARLGGTAPRPARQPGRQLTDRAMTHMGPKGKNILILCGVIPQRKWAIEWAIAQPSGWDGCGWGGRGRGAWSSTTSSSEISTTRTGTRSSIARRPAGEVELLR